MTAPIETLDPALVLGAYSVGVFPMADARDAPGVYWVEPRRRAILPPDGFHLSRSLRKTILAGRFTVTIDAAFDRTIALCAQSVANRPDTWINHSIEQVFRKLHHAGVAHSVECWEGDELVGGLYGLALERAFFGESMVSRRPDASKVALAALVATLRAHAFALLDCQFMTTHLASLGAVEVDRADYMALLATALSSPASSASSSAAGAAFGAALRAAGAASETVSGPLDAKAIVQLLTQTS